LLGDRAGRRGGAAHSNPDDPDSTQTHTDPAGHTR
jgi:hypothetical protein